MLHIEVPMAKCLTINNYMELKKISMSFHKQALIKTNKSKCHYWYCLFWQNVASLVCSFCLVFCIFPPNRQHHQVRLLLSRELTTRNLLEVWLGMDNNLNVIKLYTCTYVDFYIFQGPIFCKFLQKYRFFSGRSFVDNNYYEGKRNKQGKMNFCCSTAVFYDHKCINRLKAVFS